MVPDGLEWASNVLRTYRAARDTSWWLRLSMRQAVLEVVAEEGSRLTAGLCTLTTPVNSTLRQSLIREQVKR